LRHGYKSTSLEKDLHLTDAAFSGKWTLKGNRLTMEVAFWGGTMLHEWEITDLGDGRASIKVLNQEVKG
jgi:hypothetical protein